MCFRTEWVAAYPTLVPRTPWDSSRVLACHVSSSFLSSLVPSHTPHTSEAVPSHTPHTSEAVPPHTPHTSEAVNLISQCSASSKAFRHALTLYLPAVYTGLDLAPTSHIVLDSALDLAPQCYITLHSGVDLARSSASIVQNYIAKTT
eukprot:1386501-Rhodomonas_salina.1